MLAFIVDWSAVYFTSQSHDLILHMPSIFWVNLCTAHASPILTLPFEFFASSKTILDKDSYFQLPMTFRSVLMLIRIGLAVPLLVAPLLAILSLLVPVLFVGVQRSNLPSLDLLLKPNIVPWPTSLVNLCGFVHYFMTSAFLTINQCSSIVTIKRQYTLLVIPSSMYAQNT